MTYNVIKRENLIMRLYFIINFNFHIEDRKEFLNICDNVEINIDEIISFNHIFVIDAVNNLLMVNQSYLYQMRIDMNSHNNEMKCIIHAKRRNRVVKFIAIFDSINKNRTAENLFSKNREENLN